MAITDARMSAQLARTLSCPMCGTNQEPNLIALPGVRISTTERRVWIDGREVKLTGKELELLIYFARRAGELVTKKQLYLDVWGYPTMPRTTRTIDSHVSRLRCKITEHGASAVRIENVWGAGWRLQS